MAEGVPWQTLAALLELEESTIYAYAKEGVFVKTGRGRYLLAPSVRNYVRKLREIAAGRQGDQLNAVDENARLRIVQRRNLELRNAALDGTLVSVADLTECSNSGPKSLNREWPERVESRHFAPGDWQIASSPTQSRRHRALLVMRSLPFN